MHRRRVGPSTPSIHAPGRCGPPPRAPQPPCSRQPAAPPAPAGSSAGPRRSGWPPGCRRAAACRARAARSPTSAAQSRRPRRPPSCCACDVGAACCRARQTAARQAAAAAAATTEAAASWAGNWVCSALFELLPALWRTWGCPGCVWLCKRYARRLESALQALALEDEAQNRSRKRGNQQCRANGVQQLTQHFQMLTGTSPVTLQLIASSHAVSSDIRARTDRRQQAPAALANCPAPLTSSSGAAGPTEASCSDAATKAEAVSSLGPWQ